MRSVVRLSVVAPVAVTDFREFLTKNIFLLFESLKTYFEQVIFWVRAVKTFYVRNFRHVSVSPAETCTIRFFKEQKLMLSSSFRCDQIYKIWSHFVVLLKSDLNHY